ncbi:MAG: 16S rRNA (guanine(527)-N(7))-methyltransferase RsmG [Bacillota bacterium]|jgi:16S rRNA (guanine527-N7)-methyltransferase|nr:16S rRNA (guanine(527)-N(7))-methyltransferase RsmG [Bacillota bacterium]MDD3298025.1 16S rRNA (guanine(527)-N(7))-methyltransferase RsmG [Bacillota bacterium]MDD3850056.1 16S rRNA (guanine(527)-N(7))-methyltransferase RsmG [Bacillota bacterium]MDD4706707.1 16S rRNA (guanine(527)-N(7))-methyltransferase RsmG [Bacillota bacterium]
MKVGVELLKKGAHGLGVTVTGEQVDQLMEYMRMLTDWNKRMNLTAITEDRDVIIKHFLDSITCAATGYVNDGLKAIDVGTGAGFPGIPLKIMYPDLEITLLDSLKKRVVFLECVIARLGLKGAVPIHGRAEELARDVAHREKYQLCFSRAVAHMSVVSEYCLPFVETGGVFLAMKGPGYIEEIDQADRAIGILGGCMSQVRDFRLPFTDITHYIIIIEKLTATGSEYPRKAGRPAKKPLS